MTYELRLNDSSIFAGNVMGAFFIAVIIAALLFFLLNRLRRKLAENETLKYEFITIIAHKFRTPLTTTKWLLEEMFEGEQDGRKLESLKELKSGNEKLINLTGTLIEMTNLDNETRTSYSFKPVKICDFVKAVAESQKNLFHQKNIFLAVNCPDPDATASIDGPRLEFVLQTIMENACAYTPPGRNVEVSAGKDGVKAVIQVTDNGIGIEHGDLGRIFTKFFRTKNAKIMDTEGFGVGLFLAQAIVARHRGTISVYSEGKDKGSTFRIELPLITPPRS